MWGTNIKASLLYFIPIFSEFCSFKFIIRVKITFRATVRSEMDRERERHGNVGSQVERKERPDAPKYSVDREATCPLLLRVFCSTSRHSSMSEYSKGENISIA